jgi:hypothetical protein
MMSEKLFETPFILGVAAVICFGVLIHGCNKSIENERELRKICIKNGGTVIDRTVARHDCLIGKNNIETNQKNN